METKIKRIDPAELANYQAELREASSILLENRLVAFPTETVYGLGADARSSAAVERIFLAKGRPQDNPLIVHISRLAQLEVLVDDLNETARRLAQLYWPGPLTLVLPVKHGAVSELVTAGLSTVAVRMPDHPVALSLIEAARCPIAAPSANRSGRPSPTCAEHVMEDLSGRIDMIVDGGSTEVGLESTVVALDSSGDRLQILRPGMISAEMLRKAGFSLVDERIHQHEIQQTTHLMDETPRSPGTKYTHYAPKATMILVQGKSLEESRHSVQKELQELINAAAAEDKRTGVLTYNEYIEAYRADVVLALGDLADQREIGRNLYRRLREFDQQQVEFIAAEVYENEEKEGLSAALMNRLRKASGDNIKHIQ